MDLRTEAERSRVTRSGKPTVEHDRSKQARRLDVVVGTLDATGRNPHFFSHLRIV